MTFNLKINVYPTTVCISSKYYVHLIAKIKTKTCHSTLCSTEITFTHNAYIEDICKYHLFLIHINIIIFTNTE